MAQNLENIEKIFSEKGTVLLLATKPENCPEFRNELLKFLKSREIMGVYIAIDLRGSELIEKVDLRKVRIIDCGYPSASHLYKTLISCSSLAELSLTITQEIESLGGNCRFVVIDSLNNFMRANDEERALRFLDFLSKKLKVIKSSLILVSKSDKEYEQFYDKIRGFCDKVMVVGV